MREDTAQALHSELPRRRHQVSIHLRWVGRPERTLCIHSCLFQGLANLFRVGGLSSLHGLSISMRGRAEIGRGESTCN